MQNVYKLCSHVDAESCWSQWVIIAIQLRILLHVINKLYQRILKYIIYKQSLLPIKTMKWGGVHGWKSRPSISKFFWAWEHSGPLTSFKVKMSWLFHATWYIDLNFLLVESSSIFGNKLFKKLMGIRVSFHYLLRSQHESLYKKY